jgi:hypothetical protein
MLSSLQGFQMSAKKFVADNATTILTAGGVVGTVTTGVLAWRSGYTAYERLLMAEFERAHDASGKPIPLDDDIPPMSKIEKVVVVGPQIIPPVVIGGLTITAIIFSHRMSAQKAAAMAALYGVSERQLREYKDKVSEKLTGPKEQQVKDELAQQRADQTPGSQQIVIVEGDVLCFDELTGRYFRSTMEEIRKAVNDTNERILHNDSVSAGFFYDLLGLPPTTWTNDVGWNTDNLLDLEYSTIKSYDNKPCISINPRYLPVTDYDTRKY